MGMGIAALLIALAQAAPAAGPPPEEIVVTGEEQLGAADTRQRVVLGSRIPRFSLQHARFIASATSLGGLTSDSGMDAAEKTRTLRVKSCKATGATLSKMVACGLSPVQKALDSGDTAKAHELATALLQRPELTPEDRFVTQTFLYRIAEARGDETERRGLLQPMADSGFLSPEDRLLALRTLAGFAVKSGRESEALDRYEQIAVLDPADTRSRMNAAALLQRAGRDAEAKLRVREAIGIARQTGEPVPDQWEDLAK